jgi:transposase
MLALTPTTRVFLAAGATDMRKSFNSLAAIIQNTLAHDPTCGHLFGFCNRRRDRIKVMYWDGSGLWVCAKRLEKGTFAWPESRANSIELSREELLMLLSGIDLSATHRRRWYCIEANHSNAQHAC